MFDKGTKVVSTWSPHVTGTIVGYGYLFMNGQPVGRGSDETINDTMQQVYLVDIGSPRMFDINREPPGPAAARILCLQFDRVKELK